MSYARTAVTRMTLDMSRPDLQRSETVTLGDTNRRWEVTLINGGAPFRLPPNWTAALTGIKPDGTGLLNGCSVDDGKIIYDFAAGAEIATCAGNYPVQFDIWDEVGDLVASPKLYVNVLADVRPHEELESNGQYTLIGEVLSRVDDAEKDIDNNAKDIDNNRKNIEQTGKDVSENEKNIAFLAQYVPSADMLTIPKEAWKGEEKKYSTTLGESQENTYITIWAADDVTKKWLDENDTEVRIVDEEIIVSAKSKPEINLNIVKLVELYHNDTDETYRHVELVGLIDESERLNLGKRVEEAEKKLESAEVIGGQVSVNSTDWKGSGATIKLPVEGNTLTLLWPDNEVSSLIVNTQRIYISYSFINHETGEVLLIRGVEEDYNGELKLRYVRLPMINEDTQTAAVQIIGARYSGSGVGGGSTTIEKTTGEIIKIDVDSWSETKSVGLSTWITGPIRLSNITDTTMLRLTALNETTATDWTAGQVGAEITTDEESEIYNLRIGIIGAKPTMEWKILIESLIVEESENTEVGPYVTVVPPASDAVNKIAEHNYDEMSHPGLREQTEKNTANLTRLAERVIDKTVSDLVNYYQKSETLTKAEINAIVSAIPKFKIKPVDSLPTSEISYTTVYLVKDENESGDLYTEYIRVTVDGTDVWEELGRQRVDLTGYATEAWVNELIAACVKTADMEAYVTGLLKDYITKEDADKTYQPAGDYPTNDEMDEEISNATKDLAPKSSIPTKVSQLFNDSGYLNATTGDQLYAKPDDVVEIVANNKDEIVESVVDKLLEPIVGRNKYNKENSIPYTSSLTGSCLRGTAYLPPSDGQYTIYISSAGSGNYTYIYDPSQNDLLKTDTMVVYDENGVAVSDVTYSSSAVRNSAKTRSGKTIVVPAGANAHKLEFLYRVSSSSGATLCSEMMVTIGYMPEEYEQYKETLVLDGLDYATPGFVAENYVSKKTYYVSTTGNDGNDGSKDAPLATLKKALDLGATRIAMEVGEYFVPAVVTLSNLNDVRIYAYRSSETYDHAKPVRDKVRITGARYYSGYAKNADGVYQQSSVTGGFNYNEVFVSQSKSPAINARTYHANLMVMHEDVSKDYYLKPVLTYAECVSTENSFFWNGSTLSFNASSTDFAKVGVVYAEQCLLINNCKNLVMEDIAVEICKSNVIGINDCDGLVLNNCEANASAISMGFAFDNTNGVLNNCYATKNAYDGFNFHGYGTTTMNDCTAENNYDDGCSHHDGCIGTINGGRFSGSGKAGIAPAYGANVNIYNVIASNNNIGIGYLTTSNGHAKIKGVVAGCLLKDNNTGLQVDALASIIAIGLKYHGNTTDKATIGALEEY